MLSKGVHFPVRTMLGSDKTSSGTSRNPTYFYNGDYY